MAAGCSASSARNKWRIGLTAEVPNYFAIVGPTASGKSQLALALAKAYAGEIVNCDSVQVYQGFDIGSAKPTPQERQVVPHHLFDIRTWQQDYDAACFAQDAAACIAAIRQRGKRAILVGGTGLYLRALWGRSFRHDLPKDESLRRRLVLLSNSELVNFLQQRDPVRCTQIHSNDRFRLLRAAELVTLLDGPVSALNEGMPNQEQRHGAFSIYINPPRPTLHERIAQRTPAMLAAGLLDEVATLLAAGVDPECKPMQSIGYKQCVAVLQGREPASELTERIKAATRQYAKRQCTFFRKWSFDLEATSSTAAFEAMPLPAGTAP